jgi:glycerophosphoryl diester phosphodiesterase
MPAAMSRPLIIAHRGFSSRYVENTLPAIRAALRLGVDYVEVDVRESRDGRLVVFHDERLDRICGVPGRVQDKSLRELRALRPSIPTLSEVLRACRGNAGVLVEIKKADPRKVARLVGRCGMKRSVIVFSFEIAHLAALARADRRICRYGLTYRGLRRWIPALKRRVQVAGLGVLRGRITSRAAVERIHREGWKLFVWTVDDPVQMRRLAAWGADGIITNCPDVAKSVLARR